MPPEPLLQLKGISKSFPGVKALSKVDFTLRKGEVHALLGENGAGKSTLIKVLTEVYKRDEGEIILDGQPINIHSTEESQSLGISSVYQEINLIPTLSVAENIYLGRQPTKFGLLKWQSINRMAQEALARLNLHIDVTQQLSSYSIAIQQMVAIVRGIDLSAKVLILDEPTSSLDSKEVEKLFSVMRTIKEKGIGIIFVTHFLDQVYQISDRITVLRNGALVGEYEIKNLPKLELVAKMLGKELKVVEKASAQHKVDEHAKDTGEPYLKVNGLSKKGSIQPIDLELRKGQIVGFAGLLGSGRTEFARLLFGIDNADEGEIVKEGHAISINSPLKAIQEGFAFCPEDRKSEGIIGSLSVRENIIVALQAKQGWRKYLKIDEQRKFAETFVKSLKIATPDIEKPLNELSGGNQQKVMLARWLITNPEFLILDEPTRGIDVGAHAEIIKLILKLCEEGLALLVISSELEELVVFSDRVIVLRDRKKVNELSGNDINEHTIMHTIAE